MIDDLEVREMLQRRADVVPAVPADTPRAVRRARRRLALNGAVVAVAAVAIAMASLTGIDAIRTAPVPADTPAPASDIMRVNGEVLRFTGRIEPDILPDGSTLEAMAGDLVAVDPRTGEERVLLESLDAVYSARWSGDGRWVAYETDSPNGGRDLWVVDATQAPRVVATGGDSQPNPDPWLELDWKWSPTGAELATIERSDRLRTIDVATGETTDLGGVVADLLPSSSMQRWAWSPDGTRLVFASPWGTPNGSLDSVDVRSGERSLLARLPGSIERIRWSPDGAHIAVQTRGDDAGHLYVLDADGSDIRMVADDSNSLGFAWSPDGTRLAFGSEAGSKVLIRVATPDGAAPVDIGTVGLNNCYRTSWGGHFECSTTWSPDGTQVAFRIGETGKVTVFDAAGAGEAAPLDELTFLGWDGGWYQSP